MTSNASSRRFLEFLPLFVGFLGPPAIWSFHLLASYLLVSSACVVGETWMRAIILTWTGLCAAGIIACALLGFVEWWGADRRQKANIPNHWGRTGFMGLGAISMSAVFLVATLMEGIPAWYLTTCS